MKLYIKLYSFRVIVMSRRTDKHPSDLRLQALSLVEAGISTKEAARITGISISTINRLKQKARENGFDPAESTKLSIKHVQDRPRSGRPAKITSEKKASIIQYVEKNRNTHESSAVEIANVYDVSASTILKLLKRNKFKSCKTTKKPPLNDRMKAQRLKWCLDHEEWTLRDWKNVIWTNETSVVLNRIRGRRRVWRRSHEIYVKSVIRRRWHGSTEFMFWRCFTYDKKGPMHIWKQETAAEKRAAAVELEKLNKSLEAEAKLQWELTTGMRRTGLRNKSGKRPEWKFTKNTGKLTREEKKHGIDWWLYQKKILIPKLLPFAKECMQDRPETIVQEDNAPFHASKNQHKVFMDWNVSRLFWCANSPDLNAIEPCWFWMKRDTTRHGASRTRKDAEEK